MNPSFFLNKEKNHFRHFRKKRMEIRIMQEEIKKRTPEVEGRWNASTIGTKPSKIIISILSLKGSIANKGYISEKLSFV
jgi:hypothetical protein